jgi:hypothetical protein
MMVSMSVIRFGDTAARPQLRIDGNEPVAAIDLHAMAGIVDDGDLRARGLAQEFADHALRAGAIEIDAFGHGKADAAKTLCDGAGIVGGVGQRLDVRVGAIADDERDAAPAGGWRRRRGRCRLRRSRC